MNSGYKDARSVDPALQSLLDRHPDALIAALGADGCRIAMPACVDHPRQRPIPTPTEGCAIGELFVPADRALVSRIWQQAQDTGIGVGEVRMLVNPDCRMALTIVDAPQRHGVWLVFLTENTAAHRACPATVSDALVIHSRPRTATVYKNITGVITSIDANVTKMLGWGAEHMVGHRSTEFIHGEDQSRAIDNWMQMLSMKTNQRARLRHRRRDGSWLWIEVENIYRHVDNSDAMIEAQISDISDEMAAHEALRYREQQFSRLAEVLPIGLLQVERDGSVGFANHRLIALLGAQTPLNLNDLLAAVGDDERHMIRMALDDAFDRHQDRSFEAEVRAPNGSRVRRCTISVVAMTSQQAVPSAIVCVNDITESAQLREELHERATFDVLTGCFNRGTVMSALKTALGESTGWSTAIIFIDLDNFKRVNDMFGHSVGDELLIQVANRLKRISRADDMVGRLGGDEFLVVCRKLVDLPTQVMTIADRIHIALRRSVQLSTRTVELSASIGVAHAAPGVTSNDLVSMADQAMYTSKSRRLGPVLFEVGANRPVGRPASS